MNSKKIAIIGGGAAGIMCTATILEGWEGNEIDRPKISLFEKNKRLGAKIIISGGGRCNVTTSTFKRKELLQHYTRGAAFLDYTFRMFGPKKVRQWFEDHSVPLKQEEDGRIFPVSNDGKDIMGIFEKLFAKHKVDLHFQETIKHIEPISTGGYTLHTSKNIATYDYIVIATGGEAYAHTGSSGDGYHFARQLGHTITPLGPSLNSFICEESRIHDCSGISFPHARLVNITNPINKTSGPVLLTHFGISGPQTFVLASQCAFVKINKNNPFSILLQIDTTLSYERWEKFLLEQIETHPKRKLITVLSTQFPKRFVENFLIAHGYSQTIIMTELTKSKRQKIAQLLGNGIPLTLTQRKPGDEFVTAGGIATNEIYEKTMESKIAPGCYFVGEVLNIDGVTGGYNLQSSWATGKMAGDALLQKIIGQI